MLDRKDDPYYNIEYQYRCSIYGGGTVAREKFGTLTEQMFYILLALDRECCGVDIMEKIRTLTGGRVAVGPGTLYTLLADFQKAEYIEETAVEGRRRSYRITPSGRALLAEEQRRLIRMTEDYERAMRGGTGE